MDLAKLQEMLEAAPDRVKRLETEIAAHVREKEALQLFSQAVAGLKEDWKDADPGKYGAHWYALKGGQKAWPRELVGRAKAADKRPDPASLCDLARLDGKNCPACGRNGLLLCKYQQTEDTPFGDTWTKSFYVLCVPCKGLVHAESRSSSHRF